LINGPSVVHETFGTARRYNASFWRNWFNGVALGNHH